MWKMYCFRANSIYVSIFLCVCTSQVLKCSASQLSVPKLDIPSVGESSIKIISGKKSVDIKSGTTLHLKCTSNKPIIWAFPQNHFEDARNIKHLAKMDIKCEERYKRGTVCESTFVLMNISYEQTGQYSCFYNDTGFEITETNSDIVYVFVNDEENLLVPFEGLPYIFSTITETYPATIPCLPTNSKASVTLEYMETDDELKIGEEYGITFDPTIGFYFKNPTNNGHTNILRCVATVGDKSQDIQVNLMWNSKPIFDWFPVINDDEAQNIFVNSTFTLICSVQIDVGSLIRIDWSYPQSVKPRASESPVVTQQLSDIQLLSSKRLIVREAQKRDAATYTCCVADATKRKFCSSKDITIMSERSESFVNLTVDLDTSKPVIQNIGEEVKFVVTVHAFPDISAVKMYWLKDGEKFLSANSTAVNSARVLSKVENEQAVLIIGSAIMKDTGKYTLMGLTSDSVAEVSITLLVRGEPYVAIQNKSSFYLENKEYSLTCNVIAYPKPTLQWLFYPCFDNLSTCKVDSETKWIELRNRSSLNNESISFFDNEVDEKRGFYRIEANVTSHKSGYYRCLAKNDNGTTFKDELFIVSDINEMGFSLNASTSEAVQQEYFTLSCKVSSFVYSDISWFMKKENSSEEPTLVQPSKRVSIEFNDSRLSHISKLHLKSLVMSDSGTYSCNASSIDNIIRQSRSEEYVLVVHTAEKPKIISSNLKGQLIEASPSTMISFYCDVTGRPKPTIIWHKNKERLNTSALSGIDLEDSGQKLVIRRLVAGDSGRYECIVSNRLDSLSKYATLKIITNEPIMGAGAITGIVLFVIVGIVFVVLAIILGKKIRAERKQSREMGFITQNLLEHGALEFYNEDIPLDEQAELLPYEQCWEFPKERLKLGRTLGQGAFGRVVRAEAVGLEEGEASTTVAVKMLKERADFEQMKALVAELKIMIHLGKHLNIVNLMGAVTRNLEKGELMVIVEYCRYGNLREYLLARREYFINQIDPITGLIDYKVGIESEEIDKLEKVVNEEESIENTTQVNNSKNSTEETVSVLRDYENIPRVDSVTNYGYQILKRKSAVNDYVNCVISPHNPTVEYVNQTEPEICKTPNSSLKRTISHASSKKSRNSSKKSEKNKIVTTRDLVCFAFQVSRGMEYLQRKKLLHRDLAARNVLLADDNIVKICDFGLAKDCYKYDNYVKKGDGPLPIKWMAIESIRDKVYTSKSDVWSFGILLWELFTLGSNPYPGIEVNEDFYKKLKYGYRMEKPELCPNAVYQIMIDCWREDPKNRPDFTKLAEQLGNLLEASVRQHYLDLNDPYQEINANRQSQYILMQRQSTFQNSEYLEMNSSDYETMTISTNRPVSASYVNCSPRVELKPVIENDTKKTSESNSKFSLRNSFSSKADDYLQMNDSNSSFPPKYNEVST